MKSFWCSTSVATLVLGLSINGAQAQDDPVPQQSAAQESLSDEMGEEMDSDAMLDESEVSEEAAECEEEDEGPVHLFHETSHGIQIGGWFEAGIYENGDGNNSKFGNSPEVFRRISDGFNLNQAWIYAEKTLDTEECCCDWGFRADFIYGTDGPVVQAFGDEGWDNNWEHNARYGSAAPQLYGEYGCCDWSVKAGKFFTLIGYEVIPAPNNFFYSHSYCFYYAEPFSHTGAIATKKVSDQLTVAGGYTLGWDSGFNNANDAHTFLGSVSYTSCSEKLNVIYAVSLGDFGEGEFLDDVDNSFTGVPGVFGNEGSIYMHSLVAIYDVNECLQYVFQTDLGVNNNVTGAEDREWYGVTQYAFYTLSTCHKLGARFEWFDDSDGVRVGYGDSDYYEVTLGLNYTPNANVMIRPEVRWDWADAVAYNPDPDNFNPRADEQFYYGVDFVVIY